MTAQEVNFDGLVGFTHNYSGLSLGNVASIENEDAPAHPRTAALQGLEKMWMLAQMGFPQAVLPPHYRPAMDVLHRLGYRGAHEEVLAKVLKEAPLLFRAVTSASPMWTANAATVAPSADTQDGRVHLTPANLVSKFHRSLEPPTTYAILSKIFADRQHFEVHTPLPSDPCFADEGAANHTRLCASYDQPGIQLFVYGRSCYRHGVTSPKKFPARQTLEACQALVRLHQLREDRILFAQQNPDAIDAGVFHNDVISVGNLNTFFYHERAFVHTDQVVDRLKHLYQHTCGEDLRTVEVPEALLPVEGAVKTYLFNSQLLPNLFIAPKECHDSPVVRSYLTRAPLGEVRYVDVRESMRNGGGPACLRLRVVLTSKEQQALRGRVLLDKTLYEELKGWIHHYYVDHFTPKDLLDPQTLLLLEEGLDRLTQILRLGSIYPFQQTL